MSSTALIEVQSDPSLDGGGSFLAGPLVDFVAGVEGRFERGRPVACLEWGAGPGYIGFEMLQRGLCDELVLLDVNEKAIALVEETIRRNPHIQNRARAVLSDNLANLDGRYDIVVANPPNYKNINVGHPFGHMRNDRRPSDIGWRLHRAFYDGIHAYLNRDAVLYMSEIAVYCPQVYILGELYDDRGYAPIIDFIEMIVSGGLTFLGSYPYARLGDIEVDVVMSMWEG